MRRFLGKAVAVGLGLTSLHAHAAATTCDNSWSGTAISAQPTVNGHVIAVLGADRQIRLNEFLDASQTWKGWTVLQNLEAGSEYTDVWVQSIANPQTQYVGQNVYAKDFTGKVKQWICNSPSLGISNGNDWKCYKARYEISAIDGSRQIVGHVSSAQVDQSTPWGGRQYLFATFTDGSVKHKTWTPSGALAGSWSLTWTDLGFTGAAQSSPFALQISPTQVDLYVRRADATIWHRISTNGVWGSWAQLPTTLATGGAAVATTGELSAVVYSGKLYLYSFNTSGVLQYQVSTNGGASWSGWTTSPGSYSGYSSSFVSIVTGTTSKRYGIAPDKTIRSFTGFGTSDINCIKPIINNAP